MVTVQHIIHVECDENLYPDNLVTTLVSVLSHGLCTFENIDRLRDVSRQRTELG